MRVGFIGLGAMGLPMAVNLVRANHQVIGFDLKPGAMTAFVAAGGQAARSAAEAARDTEFLILMVVNGDQARSVLFAEAGVAEALAPGVIVIASCTQPPDQVGELAASLAARQLRMLDAPVSGGVVGAKEASLTFMCAGPTATFAESEPLLAAMGRNIFHVGEAPGAGSTAKLINQLLCGIHIAAAAEAMNVAERAGVSLRAIHEIISVSAGNSWIWGDRGPRMVEDDPAVESAVDIFIKDLGIVLDHGRKARQGLPLAAVAHQMFLAAAGLGHGGEDDSQVIKAYRALNGGAGRKNCS